MQDVYLVRHQNLLSATRGVLIAQGEHFYTLEPPWLNNASNISCISAGQYRVDFLPRSSSGRYKNVYWLRNVESRFGVLIHSGNTAAHTKGCVLIGSRLGTLGGQPAVLNSKSSLRRLVALLGTESFNLHIIGEQHVGSFSPAA